MNFYKVGFVCVFLMEEGELVERVLGYIFSNGCFPKVIPYRINVVGGESSVRQRVISGMSEKYNWVKIRDGLSSAYLVNLGPFVKRAYEDKRREVLKTS